MIFYLHKINFNIKIPENLRNKRVDDYNKYKGKIYSKYGYFESDRWMTFNARNGKKDMFVCYDKKNNIPYIINKHEDFIVDVSIYIAIASYSYNKYIIVLSPNQILANPVMHKPFPNITYESNPVIVVSQVKL